ncbi:MAG: M23 family metallopeptidase, partial [Bacillota bacterium]
AGVDLVAPAGTPVVATNAGRVVFTDRLHAAGLTVIVDHGLSLFSSYCHLSRIAVRTGDTVRKGQVVGWVGNTGFSTGPHLHWSVTVGLNSVDPSSLTGPRSWLGSLPR